MVKMQRPGSKAKYLILNGALACLVVALGFTLAMGNAWAQQEEQELRQALERESRVQKEVNAWRSEKERLVAEILNLKTELEWTQFENKRTASYIRQEKDILRRLSRQKQEIRRLRKELEPYLYKTVLRLEDKVNRDMPYLPDERRKRIRFLKQSMFQKGTSLSEKLRRVLEALQVEAAYGSSVEVRERKLQLGQEKRKCRVIRLGRTALFYLSLNGKKAGRWNRESQEWETISSDFISELQKCVNIAGKRRAAELVDLPLGGVQTASPED